MQTMAPPDGEQQQRFARIDERFDEVNRRITEGREETGRRFQEMNKRVDKNTEEVKGLRAEMHSLQLTVHRGNFALVAAVLGVIAAILTKGG